MTSRIYIFPNSEKIKAQNAEAALLIYTAKNFDPINEQRLIIQDDLGNMIECQVINSQTICKFIKYSDKNI